MRQTKLSLIIGTWWWLFSTAAAGTTVSFKARKAWPEMNWLSPRSGIMKQRGDDSKMAWAAYELSRSELARQPSDPHLQLKAAETLLKYIRHTTNGNFPRASTGKVSTGDDPESRKIWRKHAPEVLRLLEGSTAYAKSSPGDQAKVSGGGRLHRAEKRDYILRRQCGTALGPGAYTTVKSFNYIYGRVLIHRKQRNTYCGKKYPSLKPFKPFRDCR